MIAGPKKDKINYYGLIVSIITFVVLSIKTKYSRG